MDLTDNINSNYNDIVMSIIEHLRSSMGSDLAFITITLPKKLRRCQSLTQYEMSINFVKELFYTTCYKYAIVTELTKNGNVHYHILAHFRDKLARIHFCNKTRKSKSTGYFDIHKEEIKSIDQLQRVANYMVKDLDNTKKVIRTPSYKPDLLELN